MAKVKQTGTTKVVAQGPYHVKNKIFEYKFEAGKEYDIPEEHINVLLETGTVKLK